MHHMPFKWIACLNISLIFCHVTPFVSNDLIWKHLFPLNSSLYSLPWYTSYHFMPQYTLKYRSPKRHNLMKLSPKHGYDKEVDVYFCDKMIKWFRKGRSLKYNMLLSTLDLQAIMVMFIQYVMYIHLVVLMLFIYSLSFEQKDIYISIL